MNTRLKLSRLPGSTVNGLARLHVNRFLKDKSRGGIIVDYSRDYTVVNGV